MNKKDIALTVGGVLATMVVAYLIYKMQQRDAAAAAAQNEDATDEAAQNAASAEQADASASYQYASLLSQVTTPNITGTVNNTAAAVATSATTATTGDDGTTYDTTDINKLLGQIIDDYAGPLMPSSTTSSVASMTIPTIAGLGASDLSGIPITAAAAAADAAVPAITTIDNTAAYYPSNMESSWSVSSHPVQAHPIVTSGS